MGILHGGDFYARHMKWMRKVWNKKGDLPEPYGRLNHGYINRGKPKNSKTKKNHRIRESFKSFPVDMYMD